jgi:hypothetical protein
MSSDPFDLPTMPDDPFDTPEPVRIEPTLAQIDYAHALGIVDPESMDRRKLSEAIDEAVDSRDWDDDYGFDVGYY